jgi:hypothetical protein
MMMPDLINGLVELVGAFFTLKNALTLYQAKKLEGVYWPSTLFFTLWGLWNLYFYPALGQWLSFAGGAILVAGNMAWVTLAIYYLFIKKSFVFTEKDLELSIDEYDEKYIRPAMIKLLEEHTDAEIAKDLEFCDSIQGDRLSELRFKKAAAKARKTGSKRKASPAKAKKKNNGNARKHKPGRIGKTKSR